MDMDLSVYSLASAIIFFNIGLILVKMFRRSTSFLVRNSTVALLILVMLSLIRVLFPLDLEHAIVLTSQTILPSIIDILEIPVTKRVNVGTALLTIWAMGTSLILCKSFYVLIQEIQQVKKYQAIKDSRIQRIAEECLNGKATVMVSPDVDVPKVMGIRKAYIYMPPLALTNEEIRLVLLHEFQHVKGGDFFIKIFYLFIKAIYWWNPVVYLFYQEVENLLELRCDAAITKAMTDEERVTYLEAVLMVIKQAALYDVQNLTNAVGLVNLKVQGFTQQRFEVILNKSTAYRKSRSIRSICLIVIAFLVSYFVIIQPAYYPVTNEIEGYINITNENAYITIDENGLMELYVDGEFFETVDEEELSVPPYDSLKVIKKGKS